MKVEECLFLAQHHVCHGVRPAPVEDAFESESLVEPELLGILRKEVCGPAPRSEVPDTNYVAAHTCKHADPGS